MAPTRRAPVRGVLRACVLAVVLAAPAAPRPASAAEGDFVVRDFRFGSGESLPELRLHYLAFGAPRRDARGHVGNAVLILHGTGGSGRQFLARQFAGELYGAGQPLDTTRFYVILPDGIGHGHSSKPSDGLRARFPHYDYDDMVRAQHQLLVDHLHVDHLRLVMGTSMGGMHTWVWGETYPDFMDALMPLASQPIAIVGRNRLWREMIVEAIENDPEWKGGDYVHEPAGGLRAAADMLLIAGSAPLAMQSTLATRDTVDRYLRGAMQRILPTLDANDLIYQIEASRHYDPSPQLERIVAPLAAINSSDDFINPPELGNMEREIRRVKRGTYVLISASPETHGHGTHTWPIFWKDRLLALLQESEK